MKNTWSFLSHDNNIWYASTEVEHLKSLFDCRRKSWATQLGTQVHSKHLKDLIYIKYDDVA